MKTVLAPAKPIISGPKDGVEYSAFGSTLQVKVSGADTGGSLTLGLGTTPPGGGPPLHVHNAEDEYFIVLEGQMEFWVNGAWQAVEPGTAIFAPRNIPHKFRNAGSTPSRHYVFTVPSGFDEFYRKCAEVFAADADFAKIAAICDEHDVQILEKPQH